MDWIQTHAAATTDKYMMVKLWYFNVELAFDTAPKKPVCLTVYSQPYYVRFCNGFHEKYSTPFRHKKYHGCYENFYKVILIVIQAFMMQ